jgi:hypothetical protein
MGNAFSAGIFLAVAVMDLVPDSIERMEEAGCFPDLAFLIILIGYITILILEKILFSSHLTSHESHEKSAISKEGPCTDKSDRFNVEEHQEAPDAENLTEFLVAVHEPEKQFQRRPAQTGLQKSGLTSYLLVAGFSVHSVNAS